MTFSTGEKLNAAWAVDAIATPFVQGRLRKESISVTIDTVCAHCDQPINIKMDSDMNYKVVQENADPLIFHPQIDWGSFSEANIISQFWRKSVFFWSEEHAKEHLSKTEQVNGLYLTLDQAVYSIPISQGALFALN
jgi:hypothetical protein